MNVNLTQVYSPGTAKWIKTDTFILPEAIQEIYSINTNVGGEGALLGINYNNVDITGYDLFIYDLAVSHTSFSITIYTTILGRWM